MSCWRRQRYQPLNKESRYWLAKRSPNDVIAHFTSTVIKKMRVIEIVNNIMEEIKKNCAYNSNCKQISNFYSCFFILAVKQLNLLT